MGFPAKIILKGGEGRSDYVIRRINEGAAPLVVLAEINGPELSPGKPWDRKGFAIALDKLRIQGKIPPGEMAAAKAAKAAREAKPVEGDIAPAAAVMTAADVAQVNLSDEEKADLRALAEADVTDERKEQLRKEFLRQIKDDLRAKDGLRTGIPRLDELVSHTIHMPPNGWPCHIINRRVFMNGSTVTQPRHVVDSMRETEHRAWLAEARREGKPVDFYTKSHADARGNPTYASRNEGIKGGVAVALPVVV